MEKPKIASISGPTKVASTFLIAVGALNFVSALNTLVEEAEVGATLSVKLLYLGILIWSILSFIAGRNLSKRKKWAFILAIILIISLIVFSAIIIKTTAFAYGGLGLGVFVLLLLIFGRKDFKNT